MMENNKITVLLDGMDMLPDNNSKININEEDSINESKSKKSLSGSGCNFQRYCHREIFLGIDYEFNDFIQAVHRCYRFLQKEQVVIDIIYMENEREIRNVLIEK